MGWIKKAFIHSLVFGGGLLVVSILIGLTLSHPGPSQADYELGRMMGHAVGMLLGMGLPVIWLFNFVRSKKDSPGQSNELGNYVVNRYANNKTNWIVLFGILAFIFVLLVGHVKNKPYAKNEINISDKGMLVINAQPSFSFFVPKGFVQMPAERVQAPYIYGFTEENCPQESSRVCLAISFTTMGGVIDPRKPVNENEYRAGMIKGIKNSLPDANPVVTIEWIQVLNFKLPSHLITGLRRGQSPITSLGVELPLKYDAVALNVVGASNQEEKIRSIFNSIIISLKGDSV